MLADPVHAIFLKLLGPESLEYALKVFAPFLFLPFFHLSTLVLIFPVLFQNLLSANGAMRSFNYHYLTGMTPFLFISTIYALARLNDQRAWVRKHLVWIGFLLLFVSVLRSGPSEYWFFWNIHSHRTPHTEMIREKLGEIPREARVLTHNTLVPQMCNRKSIYQFNYNAEPTKANFAKKYAADYVIWDQNYWEPNTASMESCLTEFRKSGYLVSFQEEQFYILKKQSAAN